MKTKIAVSLLVILSTIAVGKVLTVPANNEVANAQEAVPDYAKWSKVAIEKVKAKYSSAEVVDYLHIGRESGAVTSVEKFKLWLKIKGQREFGVYVDITFNNQTQEIVDIKYTETNQ
ncbi:DUF3889 domain-containing protein [Lysinibacillus yapensis]|uniref:DUF3889 domain-containing protein n=1 Tax=Ureibacillus yapensis TaxID=2304605 RepID=A0A396SAK9_9BACL|nr:DUF3889 domain-containing protein [Lysinibacillus yapensis]RHW38381.1 DUF3889 domain-containing protein [Lysinibacillus yapensis]